MNQNMIFLPKKCWMILVLTFMLASCSWIEDSRDHCPSGVKVQLYVDASNEFAGLSDTQSFYNEIEEVTLWVFDQDNKYIGVYTESGEELKKTDYIMTLPLNSGNYQFIAWVNADAAHYDFSNHSVGDTSLSDHSLTLKRSDNREQNDKLKPLWHGALNGVNVVSSQYTLARIKMMKKHNIFTTVIQDMTGQNLSGDNYNFRIACDNGIMDGSSALLADNQVSYGAYLVATANVDNDNQAGETRDGTTSTISVARAELNTLKLTTTNPARFIVTNKTTGKDMLNINLTQYLLLTREMAQGSSGSTMTDQEYLDNQHKYNVVFFMGSSGGSDGYQLIMLQINGWIIRLNNTDL